MLSDSIIRQFGHTVLEQWAWLDMQPRLTRDMKYSALARFIIANVPRESCDGNDEATWEQLNEVRKQLQKQDATGYCFCTYNNKHYWLQLDSLDGLGCVVSSCKPTELLETMKAILKPQVPTLEVVTAILSQWREHTPVEYLEDVEAVQRFVDSVAQSEEK